MIFINLIFLFGFYSFFLFYRYLVFGRNAIVVPVQSILTLLFLEVLNPFYIFQFFSFCLWFADDYMYYAIAIITMSAFGVVMSIVQTRKVSHLILCIYMSVNI